MRPKRQRVLLRDVAEKASVSESTASKVLAGKAIVSEETREAIFAAAEALGYRAFKKPAVIGLIAGFYDRGVQSKPFISEVLHGVEQACRLYNVGLMYTTMAQETLAGGESLPLMLQQQQIQGALVLNIYNDDFYHLLQEQDIPFVCISHYLKWPHVDVVVGDDEEGGYLATSYLLKHGHRNPPPAMLMGVPALTSLHRRYLGYRRALDEFGVAYDPRYVWVGENGFVRGREGIRALFSLPVPPTAIFCGTDSTAIFALETLEELGIVVPEQCSLIGFDDIDQAPHARVPLTTIHIDNGALGTESVRFLLTRMDHPDLASRCLSLGVRLVERRSVCSYSSVSV